MRYYLKGRAVMVSKEYGYLSTKTAERVIEAGSKEEAKQKFIRDVAGCVIGIFQGTCTKAINEFDTDS